MLLLLSIIITRTRLDTRILTVLGRGFLSALGLPMAATGAVIAVLAATVSAAEPTQVERVQAAVDGWVEARAPIEKITGIQGVAEDADPPNNNGYERTLCLTKIEQAVQALMPFVDATAAKGAGFDTSKSFPFEPFNPTLPSPLGDFISFKG